MSESIIVQQPVAAEQLILLFHGVGAAPENLVPLGRMLAHAFPGALIVSVRSPQRSDFGTGYQWFSVAGVTEENRPGRVTQAMPGFLAEVARWQAIAGVKPEATVLIGFSQGAIMSLEATNTAPAPARRIVALAGRFAALPARQVSGVTIHLIHGNADRVMPVTVASNAAERLRTLGTRYTADVLPNTGHEITREMAELAIRRLVEDYPAS